jgi:hypothetical protein
VLKTTVRRTPVILALTALVAAGLVGCSTSGPATCTSASDAGLLDLVDVSGQVGSEPQVSMKTPFHVAETKVADVELGDGTAITEPNQLALVDVTVFSGETGESVVSTRYSDSLAQVPALSQLAATFPTLADDLQCATEGSRLVVALAPEDIPEEVAAQLAPEQDESLVLVVDLRRVYLAKADGADQFTESHGLPTVVRAPDGRPGIIIPDADAPTEQVVETLKRGDGPEVAEGSSARVALTGVRWDTRDVTVNTWEAGQPETLVPGGQDSPAFAEALVGQTVGSQLLVVEPGEGSTSAVAYVVDILGVDE